MWIYHKSMKYFGNSKIWAQFHNKIMSNHIIHNVLFTLPKDPEGTPFDPLMVYCCYIFIGFMQDTLKQ